MNAPDREAWLAARRQGIGGTDVSALLGMSPYKSQMQLWLDKTGRAEESTPDADALERMHFGVVLEHVVAAEYALRTGRATQRINGMLRHPECPIAIANIDRAVVAPGSRARWDDKAKRVLGAEAVLECKTAHAMALHGANWGEAGSDEVPQHYWTQIQWYMGITGLPRADLACLFGGQHLRIYTVAADTQILFGDLLTEADRWWRAHVLADVPPQPTSEEDARWLWRSHVAGRERIVDVLVADAVQQLVEVKAQIAELEREEQELRDTVTCEFGDAESISYMGRKLATWKANKPSRKTDWKAVATDCAASAECIQSRTTETPGARVLRLSITKETP